MTICEFCDAGRHRRCRGRCGGCLVCEIGGRRPESTTVCGPTAPRRVYIVQAGPDGRAWRGSRSRLPKPMRHAVAAGLVLDGLSLAETARVSGASFEQVRTIQRNLKEL